MTDTTTTASMTELLDSLKSNLDLYERFATMHAGKSYARDVARDARALIAALEQPGGRELNDKDAAAFAASLDGMSQERLLNALRDQRDESGNESIVETVRETLAKLYGAADPKPVAVLFQTMGHDNGHFLNENGEVLFDDGTTDDVEFPIDDLLSEVYGRVADRAGLGINLLTGDVDFDGDSSWYVAHRLGFHKS